jgi:hypothetical protein
MFDLQVVNCKLEPFVIFSFSDPWPRVPSVNQRQLWWKIEKVAQFPLYHNHDYDYGQADETISTEQTTYPKKPSAN